MDTPANSKPEKPGAHPAPVEIKFQNGQKDVISFPDLDVFERERAVQLLAEGRTAELVMLCIRRNAAFVKTLDPVSYLDLIKPSINAVFPWALVVAARDPILGLKWGPIILEMAKLLQSSPSETLSTTDTAASMDGNGTSKTPAPEASAAATGAPAPATPPAASPAS